MANTPFLITGLPRSRTAWLAKVATIEGWSKCEHEPSIHFGRHKTEQQNYEAFLGYWMHRKETYAGISDYHLAHTLPNLLKTVQMRTLIVCRPFNDVQASLHKAGLQTFSQQGLDSFKRAMGIAIGDPLVKTIPYSELSNSHAVAEALKWLMPNAPVSVAAIEALQDVHIEADLEKNRQIWHETNPGGSVS